MQYENFALMDDSALNQYAKRKVQARFNKIVNYLDKDLTYGRYDSASGGSQLVVNAHDLEIGGYVSGKELENLEQITEYDDVLRLRQDVSESMAKAAFRINGIKSSDSEFDYPVFISTTDRGSAYFMFRDSDKNGMITSRREGNDGQVLVIESKNIETRYEQKVLLGGLATFMLALENDFIKP
ncbi:MAG TPA: hypothetical protein VFS65_01695 [Candidatus Saccharimonadales bacterium]|nr:hypothetical protein [Candidatus Saccharimonadales bacterium]